MALCGKVIDFVRLYFGYNPNQAYRIGHVPVMQMKTWVLESDREHHHYKLGLEVLRDVYTLASCEYFLAGMSNVSLAAQYIRIANGSEHKKVVILDNGINRNNNVIFLANGKKSVALTGTGCPLKFCLKSVPLTCTPKILSPTNFSLIFSSIYNFVLVLSLQYFLYICANFSLYYADRFCFTPVVSWVKKSLYQEDVLWDGTRNVFE